MARKQTLPSGTRTDGMEDVDPGSRRSKRFVYNSLLGVAALVLLMIVASILDSLGRTPSRERFSEACDIRIPKNVKVIADRHYSFPDYYIEYEIKLDSAAMQLLTESILRSKHYGPYWQETEYGYRFDYENEGENRWTVRAMVYTASLRARFEEGS